MIHLTEKAIEQIQQISPEEASAIIQAFQNDELFHEIAIHNNYIKDNADNVD